MTPDKRKKVQALMDSTTNEHEKEICRKLLEQDPPETPQFTDEMTGNIREIWDRMSDSPFMFVSPILNFVMTGQGGAGGGVGVTGSVDGGAFSVGQNISINIKRCELCKNRFTSQDEKAVYCEICLSALRKDANET